MVCRQEFLSVMRLLLLAALACLSLADDRERRTVGVIFRGLVEAHTRTTPKPKADKLRQPPPPTVYLIPVSKEGLRGLRVNATQQPPAIDKILEDPTPVVETKPPVKRNPTTEPKQFVIRIAGDEGKSIMIRIVGDDVKVKKADDDAYMIGVSNQEAKAKIKIELPEKNVKVNPNHIPVHPNSLESVDFGLEKPKKPHRELEEKDANVHPQNYNGFAIPYNPVAYSPYYNQPGFLPSAYPVVPYPPQTPQSNPEPAKVQLTVSVKDESGGKETRKEQTGYGSQQPKDPYPGRLQQQSTASGWNYPQYSPYLQPPPGGAQQQQAWNYNPQQQQQQEQQQQAGWNYAQYTPYPSYLQDTLAPPYLGYRFQRSTNSSCLTCAS